MCGVQGCTINLGYKIVQLQQLNDRLVDQAAAVNAQHHTVLAVQLTDEGISSSAVASRLTQVAVAVVTYDLLPNFVVGG